MVSKDSIEGYMRQRKKPMTVSFSLSLSLCLSLSLSLSLSVSLSLSLSPPLSLYMSVSQVHSSKAIPVLTSDGCCGISVKVLEDVANLHPDFRVTNVLKQMHFESQL
jgi:hypothetical protein